MATLLIVDDSPEMRRLIGQVAGGAGDVVVECADGDEVAEAYAAHRPDWVLMDVEMRRVDGLEAAPALTRLHPEAKVVIVTKHSDEETRSAALESGALFFVVKDDLLSLRALLRGG